MSIPLPFLGALLAGDLHRSGCENLDALPDGEGPRAGARIAAAVVGAALLALAVGALGGVTSALAVANGSTDAWRGAGTIAVGCLLVAVIAQLVGTGFGLLIRNPVLACAATVAVPLGLWLLLGVGFLEPAQAWLTPFPSAQHLLSGDMSGLAWPQWIGMALLWGVGLNAIGAAGLRGRRFRLAKPTPR